MSMLSYGQVAPIRRRVWACVVDALLAAVIPVLAAVVSIVLVLGPLRGAGSAQLVTVLGLVVAPCAGALSFAWALVYTAMQAGRGSVGMRAQGIRLVSVADGAPVSFWRALLRNLVFGATAAFVIGMFSPLFDGTGRFQGWHDRIAGALMLDARVPAPEPEPEPEEAPPAPPLLPAPTFDRLPPAPMPGFAPAAGRDSESPASPAPPRPPAPATPAAPTEGLISVVPGVTPGSGARPVVPPAPAESTPDPLPPAPPARRAGSAFTPGAPAPQAPAPQSPAPRAPEPDAGDGDIEHTRLSVPGHRLLLTWDDGTRVTVSRRTVFGRNPAEEPGAVVVPVRDETLSLSKTHFEAAAEASGGWIMDRHSTNGTVIVREGDRIECPPGQRVPIRLGDAIEIGDRVATIGGYV